MGKQWAGLLAASLRGWVGAKSGSQAAENGPDTYLKGLQGTGFVSLKSITIPDILQLKKMTK